MAGSVTEPSIPQLRNERNEGCGMAWARRKGTAREGPRDGFERWRAVRGSPALKTVRVWGQCAWLVRTSTCRVRGSREGSPDDPGGRLPVPPARRACRSRPEEKAASPLCEPSLLRAPSEEVE